MNVTFQDIANKKAELDAIMQEYGETAVKTFLKEFFDTHPDVTQLCWVQYTPYFNDGDPCVFHTHEINVGFTAETIDLYAKEGQRYNEWYGDDDDESSNSLIVSNYYLREGDFQNDFKALCKTISSNQDTMRIALGDHAEVVAKPDSITVTEYQHD